MMVQLTCVVTHGCQWFDPNRGLGSSFGGTNNPHGTHAMSQTVVSIDLVDLVRKLDFQVGWTVSPTTKTPIAALDELV